MPARLGFGTFRSADKSGGRRTSLGRCGLRAGRSGGHGHCRFRRAGAEPCRRALCRCRCAGEQRVSCCVRRDADGDSGAPATRLLPVDSEHNGVFQLLNGRDSDTPAKIILTASGGPFREMSLDDMAEVTPEMAVAHPNWTMGAKISVDSATMMNKGLELIEARVLFDVDPEMLDVVVHPQSIVHAFVHFRDGSVLAHMATPDMRVPLAYCLGFPERMDQAAPRLILLPLVR